LKYTVTVGVPARATDAVITMTVTSTSLRHCFSILTSPLGTIIEAADSNNDARANEERIEKLSWPPQQSLHKITAVKLAEFVCLISLCGLFRQPAATYSRLIWYHILIADYFFSDIPSEFLINIHE